MTHGVWLFKAHTYYVTDLIIHRLTHDMRQANKGQPHTLHDYRLLRTELLTFLRYQLVIVTGH